MSESILLKGKPSYPNLKPVLIFDMDGTLFDSEKAYAEALEAIDIDPLGESYQRARREVKERLGKDHVCSHNRLLYFKTMFELDSHFSPSAVLEIMDKYESTLQQLVAQQWKTLNREKFFQELIKHYQVVLLTNENTRTQLLKLRAIDPSGVLFQHVITSEDVGVEKPAVEMFRVAQRRFNAIASQCCMIGDSLECDITPALQLGMKAIWYTEFAKAPAMESAPIGGIRVKRVADFSQLDLALMEER